MPITTHESSNPNGESWPRGKYFPIQSDLAQSISILSHYLCQLDLVRNFENAFIWWMIWILHVEWIVACAGLDSIFRLGLCQPIWHYPCQLCVMLFHRVICGRLHDGIIMNCNSNISWFTLFPEFCKKKSIHVPANLYTGVERGHSESVTTGKQHLFLRDIIMQIE